MKTILTSLILLLGINNCQEEYMELNYLAQSRGFFLEIQLQSNVLRLTNQRGGEAKERELSKIELEDLSNILGDINFEEATASEGVKRYYDAAAMASLRLTLNGNHHEFMFDHGNPPKKLETLVNKIITLSEIVEKAD